MKKNDSLMQRVEVFEKLALYGDRKSFLRSLGQLDPKAIDEAQSFVVGAVVALSSAVNGWINNHAEKQADLPSGLLPGLPLAMRTPSQVIAQASTETDYDLDKLTRIYSAARNLAAVANLGDMGDYAKDAWMKDVFPKASTLISVAQKEIQMLKQWQEENSYLNS